MNTVAILKNGHKTISLVVEGLQDEDWDTPGVVGYWSVKGIIAHLASFEHVLVDILQSILVDSPTPTLNGFSEDQLKFNDVEVGKRQFMTIDEIWSEYERTHIETLALLEKIPEEVRDQNERLPWFDLEYNLNEFITYTFYGHKREHAAQIAMYRDQLRQKEHGQPVFA